MLSGVFEGDGSVAVREAPVPEPGPGEVRVRIDGCGVCGSDLPVWQGRPWFDYPREPGAPGHEGWGMVDALGPTVDAPEPGTRVAALSHRAYAEYDIAAAGAVVPLPDELAGQPFPGEALSCAVNVVRRSELAEGQTVAVVGIGFLGALIVQLAVRAGTRVIALSRRPFALEIARRMGASETIRLAPDAEAAAGELTGGEMCERVVEATGRQRALDIAARLTRVRGRLVIAGFHQDGSREVDMQLWNWRGLDVINAHERDPGVYLDGIRRAVELVARGELDPRPLYTHSFELARLDEALTMAAERPDGFLKALVRV